MRYALLKTAFAVWVAAWLFLVARELFVKDNLRDYRELFGRSIDGKHAYVVGDKLYDFLALCQKTLPPGATYSLAGIEEGSLDKRRAVYMLYPALEKADADYLLVYGGSCTERSGYIVIAGTSGSECIMKRVPAR
jgi:hypothetical protein